MDKDNVGNLPDAQEIERFITGLCGRDDLPLSRFFQQYWIRDRHINRLPHLMHRLAPLLSRDMALLDVGSFGEWPLLLWRYLGMHNLTACSLEGGYLAFGEGILKSKDEPGKEFDLHIKQINIELESLPARDESIDVITFFEVLEHLRVDPIFTMKEFNRILRPGGLLLLTTPNIGSFEGLVRILNSDTPNIFSQYFPHRQGMGHTKEYAIKEASRLCDNCGFSIEAVETFDSHPPLGLDTDMLQKFEPLKEVLPQYGWSIENSRQTMLIIARRVREVRYRCYQPLYTIDELATPESWRDEGKANGGA